MQVPNPDKLPSLADRARRTAPLALLLLATYAAVLSFASLRVELGQFESLENSQSLRSAFAPTSDERNAQAEELFALGRKAHRARQLTYAEELYRRALASYQATDNDYEQVRVLNGLGLIRRQWGDRAEARSLHRKALSLAEKLNHPALIAQSYNNLGIIAQLNGEGKTAEKFYEETLKINQELGNLAAVSAAHNNLGILAKERGEFVLAEDHHRRSLEASTQAGDRWGLIGAHNRLGDAERRKGNREQARTHYETSLRLAQELGSVYDQGLNYLGLAFLEIAQGNQWEACDLLTRAQQKLKNAHAPERHKASRLHSELAC